MKSLKSFVSLKSLVFAVLLACTGCRFGDMYDQPRYETYEASSFFDDGASARPLVPGVVPRSEPENAVFTTGRGPDGAFVDELPMKLDRKLLERGGNRFRIYCAPCHGLDGAGRGPIVERGFSPPPALYETKVVTQPLGYYFDVITNGQGAMYGYAARVKPNDRWAIAAYLRALQLSQHADPANLPDADRQELEQSATKANEPAPAEGHR